MSANALTFFSVDRFTGNVNGILDWLAGRVVFHCRCISRRLDDSLSSIFLFFPPSFVPFSQLNLRDLFRLTTSPSSSSRRIRSIDRSRENSFRRDVLYRESKDTKPAPFPFLSSIQIGVAWNNKQVREEKRLEERGLFNIDLEPNESWSPTVILLISTTANDNPCFIGYRLGFRLRNGKEKEKKEGRKKEKKK